MIDLLPVQIIDNDKVVIDSRIVAKGLGIDHSNFLETIKKHQAVIERDFARVLFKTETLETKGGKQQVKFALLTEGQLAFIVTLSRNTPKVVEFKSKLVRSFSQARQELEDAKKASKLNQSQSIVTTQNDNIILSYMDLLREKSKLVASLDDAIKLKTEFCDFLDQYNSLIEEEKKLKDKKSKLAASFDPSLQTKPIQAKLSLPSVKQADLSQQEIEILDLFIKKCSSSILDNHKSSHYLKKPKGKNSFSTLVEIFEDSCKKESVKYAHRAIEASLESIGWKRDAVNPNRWVIYF
jgi:Rha family phage regulatory protein